MISERFIFPLALTCKSPQQSPQIGNRAKNTPIEAVKTPVEKVDINSLILS